MRRLRAVFFDLDGILVNSLHFHWLKVREFTGVDISLEEFKSVHVGNFFCGSPHVAWLSEADWGLYPGFIFDDHMSIPMVQSAKSVMSPIYPALLAQVC